MKSNDAELASQGRRLAGAVLDGFLFVLTLGIGWVIWYLIVARGGQSPAKQLLRTRVIRGDGQSADLGWMLIRDLVVRAIAFGAVNGVLVLRLPNPKTHGLKGRSAQSIYFRPPIHVVETRPFSFSALASARSTGKASPGPYGFRLQTIKLSRPWRPSTVPGIM